MIFKLLASPGVAVRVCAVSVPDGVEIECGAEFDATSLGYPGPLAVDFKAIDEPFEVGRHYRNPSRLL